MLSAERRDQLACCYNDSMLVTNRWYRFSLRTLFIAIAVVGVAAGWLVRESQFIQARREFMAQADRERQGLIGFVHYASSPTIPVWRMWLGDSAESRVILPATWSNADLEKAKRLFPEAFQIAIEEVQE